MAIEIPRLVADRLAHPDWGGMAAPERVSVAATRLLAWLEDLPQAEPLRVALRHLAEHGASVDVYLGADTAGAQVSLDGRRVALPPSVAEAVRHSLEETPVPEPVPAPRTGPAPLDHAPATATLPLRTLPVADGSAAARAAYIDAQVQEARQSLVLPAVVDPKPRTEAPVVIATPLLAGPAAGAAPKQLSQAVEHSGLFLEAHVAQWLAGTRTLRQLQEEVRAVLARVSGAEAGASDRRAAVQFDALRDQSVGMAALAWPGQPVRIDVERDRTPGTPEAAQGPALFQATLALHLPHLGTVRARIRVLDSMVGIQFESEDPERLGAALPDLHAALDARGLALAELAVEPLAPGETA